jgi:hypothetical protein
MPRTRNNLPRPGPAILTKRKLLEQLRQIDQSTAATQRVLELETAFLRKVQTHIDSLPAFGSAFEKFHTSPFVLLFHARQRAYTKVSQMERDILPAKQFSSMETSAGRMVESIALPQYGWQLVPSQMHSSESALDGKRLTRNQLYLVTLKCGPRCLNDEMSENFADSILRYSSVWAKDAGVKRVDFTYGVLYGTQKQSNKKDWHILRKIAEKLPKRELIKSPANRWDCEFKRDGVDVRVTVRIGADWWAHLGGETCLVEVCAALIRACVQAGTADPENYKYTISDLGDIVSTKSVPLDFNVSIMQRSQIQWLFFIARHFCDSLVD